MLASILNLSLASPGPEGDHNFCYKLDNIDRVPSQLHISWELSKDIPFSAKPTFISLLWDLTEHTVTLTETKWAKYVNILAKWEAKWTHTLMEVQKLHSKLIHATFICPAGWAYLTNLKAMLPIFDDTPFTPRTTPMVPQMTGRAHCCGFPCLPSQSSRLNWSLTSKPSLMPVLALELESLLTTCGMPGASNWAGTWTIVTLVGLRVLDLNSLCVWSLQPVPSALISRFSGTTLVWSVAEWMATAETAKSTLSSEGCTTFYRPLGAKSLSSTSPMQQTQQTDCQGAYIPPHISSSPALPSTLRSAPSSKTAIQVSTPHSVHPFQDLHPRGGWDIQFITLTHPHPSLASSQHSTAPHPNGTLQPSQPPTRLATPYFALPHFIPYIKQRTDSFGHHQSHTHWTWATCCQPLTFSMYTT